MYTVFLCVCTFCMQLPFDPRRLLLDHLQFSLSELDDACHTNEMVVYHKASRSIICVDLTTPLGHDPIVDSIDFKSWCWEWLCRTISSKISSSLLSLSSDLSISIVAVSMVLMHKVTHKVWSVFNFCGRLHPRKLNTTKFFVHEIYIFSMKYLWSTVHTFVWKLLK